MGYFNELKIKIECKEERNRRSGRERRGGEIIEYENY